MSEKTFRCGWRYDRPAADDIGAFKTPPSMSVVTIRRGDWRLTMHPNVFDTLTDEEFAASAALAYRDSAFEQLQQDLDVLARQLIGELEQGNGMIVTGVPYDDVKAALYRWQKAKRDTEEEGA